MSICQRCGAPFFFETAAWGGEACGDCIAASIEYSLLGNLAMSQRKPMHRATAGLDAQHDRQSASTDGADEAASLLIPAASNG